MKEVTKAFWSLCKTIFGDMLTDATLCLFLSLAIWPMWNVARKPFDGPSVGYWQAFAGTFVILLVVKVVRLGWNTARKER